MNQCLYNIQTTIPKANHEVATTSALLPVQSNALSNNMQSNPVFPKKLLHIFCVTALPQISWKTVPTSEASKSCSAMPTSKPHKFTHTSQTNNSKTFTKNFIVKNSLIKNEIIHELLAKKFCLFSISSNYNF